MITNSSIFLRIAKGISSLDAVMTAMLSFTFGMVFFSHNYFVKIFPDSMGHLEKSLATWFMAYGWEFTVVITTCNPQHVNRKIPVLMSIASGVNVLFFLQGFDFEAAPMILIQRWFVAILAGTVTYVYAELFYKKLKERLESLTESNGSSHDLEINELRSLLNQSKKEQDQSLLLLNENQIQLNQSISRSNEAESKLIEMGIELNNLRNFKNEIERQLTCEYCGQIQKNHDSARVHKGYCKKKQLQLVN